MSYTSEQAATIRSQLDGKFLFGYSELIDLVLVAFLSRGHVLLEGPPGTAKTLSAKLLSHILAKSFKRIQFTTDMLPGDILGAHLYSPSKQEFQFIPGPIFADFILADEINRTPPRTQSALLEAMEEKQVTIEGKTHRLSPDFFVMATQNPFDYEGTFPLPEVQMDRFLMKLIIHHAAPEIETEVLKGIISGVLPPDFTRLHSVTLDREKVEAELQQIAVDSSLLRYITEILDRTRKHPMLISGVSIRGGIALVKCARAQALLEGRSFVTPDDIKRLAIPTLRHRIKLNPEAQVSSLSDESVLQEIIGQVGFPK